MNELPEGADTCPICGWTQGSRNEAHQLEPGSILSGRYLVGRALGQGGFGITYLAWDLSQGRKVAIKEYYPSALSTRQLDRHTVNAFTGANNQEIFKKGRKRFCDEANNLAQFAGVPGIVSAYGFFEENGTAYIVMEYLEGRTLKDELQAHPDPMSLEETLKLLTPVASALEAVHAAGLVHRDISPDNIMLTPTGAKLLDFGAARAFSLQGERSNTINVKMGYAPQEQYNVHGDQGAWTDVYALAATVYRCVTGKVPEQYLDRTPVDNLTRPSALNRSITPQQEEVILKGMALDYRNRYQTVRELMEALKNPLSSPWYATKSDKFVGGESKTVAIDQKTLNTMNVLDTGSTVNIQPPPPVRKPLSDWKLFSAIILSFLGTLVGVVAIPTCYSGLGQKYPYAYWAYAILQVLAVLCSLPVMKTAWSQLKRGPRKRWGKLPVLALILTLLIPLFMVVLGTPIGERRRGVVFSGDIYNLLYVYFFAVCQLLADFLAYGSPFPPSPKGTVPRAKLIFGFLLAIAGALFAEFGLVVMSAEFETYNRIAEWYFFAPEAYYLYFIFQVAAILTVIPTLKTAMDRLRGKQWSGWKKIPILGFVFSVAIMVEVYIFSSDFVNYSVLVGDDALTSFLFVMVFILTQLLAGFMIFDPLGRDIQRYNKNNKI